MLLSKYILGVLTFGLLHGFPFSPISVVTRLNTPTTATSTIPTPTTNSPVTPATGTTTQTTAKPSKPVTVPIKYLPTQPRPPVTTVTPTTTDIALSTPEPTIDFTEINKSARKAIVNILCTNQRAEEITGTGVIIDPHGIILTNAHVAEYFLLQNYPAKNYMSCIIRTGNPAYPTYHAELTYISPTWVTENKSLLTESNPTGTGQYDFAFLRITDRIDGSPLESTFPHISLGTDENIERKDSVVLVSYPAGFLGGQLVMRDLNIMSAVATVEDYFTFDTGSVDLISVPGTVLSQKGSSGGAVVNAYNKLIGIIVTSSDGKTTSDRDLRAITLGHIDRILQSELGYSLSGFLAQDLTAFGQKFNTTTAPILTKLITNELGKMNR